MGMWIARILIVGGALVVSTICGFKYYRNYTSESHDDE